MIQVYVVYAGSNTRTYIPGSPWTSSKDAHIALAKYADDNAGSWLKLIAKIDEYGFVIKGMGTVQVSTI